MHTDTAGASAGAADQVDALLTSKELANRLKVKESYLDWLRHRHGMPWVRVGGEVRFNAVAVNAWLQERATSQSKGVEPTAGVLKAGLKLRVDFAQWEALRKHVIALACYRGTDGDEELLDAAYKEVRDPAYRKVLFAVYAAARQMAEAAYYERHSALADSDATNDDVKAQIRVAHENSGKLLDSIVHNLLRSVPTYIEAPLKGAAGNVGWAGLASEGLASIVIAVSSIRELCEGGAEAADTKATSSSEPVARRKRSK